MNMLAEIYCPPGTFVAWLAAGLIAGWFARLVMESGGYGLVGDIIVGLIGAVVGGLLFGLIDIGKVGFWGSTAVAFLGACLFVAVVRYVGPARPRLCPVNQKNRRTER